MVTISHLSPQNLQWDIFLFTGKETFSQGLRVPMQGHRIYMGKVSIQTKFVCLWKSVWGFLFVLFSDSPVFLL